MKHEEYRGHAARDLHVSCLHVSLVPVPMPDPTTNNPTAPPLLAMRGITKRFPGVVALQDVSLSLRPGEVLALMGENGAGKSTLMKILGGAYAPDGGEILIDGQPVTLKGISDAKKRGIALIHQ